MSELLGEIRDYWTMRAEGYSCSVNNSIETGQSEFWLKMISKYIDLDRPLRILDVGTGPGFFPMLLGHMNHSITAVDYTESMLNAARDNCKKSNVNVTLLQMDAQNLEFDDESFDLVISRNLVWDLEYPIKAYKEWMRVLTHDGKMIIFDGNHYLHLFDEKYENTDDDRSHKSEYMMGVDANIMQNIAKELPLSKERRPQWDAAKLMEMGTSNVSIYTDPAKSIHISEYGEDLILPLSFMICATKI